MEKAYYFSTKEDPFFLGLEGLLSPLISDVLACKENAAKKAIRSMSLAVSLMPITSFKDPAYTRQIITAIKHYLKFGDIQPIKQTARKRRTDRLELMHTIASDVLEYLAFLPMKLAENPENIHRYLENMDNALWILRRLGLYEKFFKKLKV